MNHQLPNLATLGAAVRARRESLGLSQARLATLSELSRVTINELENGQLAELGIGRVMRLLENLGFSLELALKRSATEKPARRALMTAARTASVSYRNELPPIALATALRTGNIPREYRAHFATLLDEAPIPVVIRAVEESFATNVPRSTWRHIAKWAVDLKSTRTVWH